MSQKLATLNLDKIGMADSTYEQPLPPARAIMAASATHGDGMPVSGKWHVYPEMAAAGLWTTSTDLAKFGIEIALSKQGKANHVLSEATTREMLKAQIEQVGLGFFLGEYKNPEEFGHNGSDEGFQAVLIMFADSGKGVAIMANSDNGINVANYLTRSLAKEYGWNYTPEKPFAADLLMLVAATKGPQAVITRYAELKTAGSFSPYTLDENALIGTARKEIEAGLDRRHNQPYGQRMHTCFQQVCWEIVFKSPLGHDLVASVQHQILLLQHLPGAVENRV